MKKKDVFTQQGDVLMFHVDSIPADCKKVKAERGEGFGLYILARGEATGHHHSIEEDSDVALLEAPDKTLFLNLTKEKTVKHQEHGPVTLKPGKYRIGLVKEVDPFAQEVDRVRAVRD